MIFRTIIETFSENIFNFADVLLICGSKAERDGTNERKDENDNYSICINL